MFGPMSARGRRLSDDPSRRAPEEHRCVGQAGPLCQWMGDRNEQYLLDHWCGCRRSCRIGLSWSSLTPKFDRRRAVRRLRSGVGGCVLAGLWGRLSLDRVPQRLLAESRGLRAPHRGPHLLIFASFTHQPGWAVRRSAGPPGHAPMITMADGVVKHLTGFWGRMI